MENKNEYEDIPESTSIRVTSRTIMDVLAAVAAALPAFMQFMRGEQSYELIFLAAFCFALYIAWRQNQEAIQAILKRERDCVRDAEEVRDETTLKINVMQASLMDMWQDMMTLDKSQLGRFEMHPEAQVMFYKPLSVRGNRQ